tara:strand:- start:158 stop:2650 length:2493 start_codon:yes stop_codon:yes gene_type:complete
MNRILKNQSAAIAARSGKIFTAMALWMVFCLVGIANAASPDFQNTVPRGGQIGKEVKVTFSGTRLIDAVDVISHYPGITAKDLKVIDTKKVEVTLVVAPDCRLGEHHLRLRCKSGISYARNFWISQFPNVAEVEPNDDFEVPQKIDLNVTVEAEAKSEETDYYQVSAKKGQRLSIEIEGLRINNIRNNIAIDPFVSILNKDRFEIASADGSALLKQESILSIIVPEDGDYIVEVRDSAYQGRGRYRAHIGTFPRPLGVYPAGGKAGTEVEFKLIGDVKGDFMAKAKLPMETEEGTYGVFGVQEGLKSPSPNPVRVCDFDNYLETEPNNSSKEPDVYEGTLPIAFNGILQEADDVDYFKFTAKKGQSFLFQAYANTLGSPVDPVLNIYDSKMKSLGGSDDADGTKDGRITFKASADGEYFVRLRDMLYNGGPNFVYRIEAQPNVPRIDVTMPEMLRRELQYRKQFNVPRGGYYAMVVNTTRRNFTGELEFSIPKLPDGVTWESGTIPKTVSQFPILLKAAPDAPIAGGMYDLFAKSADPDLQVSGKFKQSLDLVRGPQNGVEYYTRKHNRLPVAVTEELPFSVTIEQPKVPIVRNGTLKLKLHAKRKEGFDKKITARFLWKPPGITSPSTITFGEKDSVVEYELNASATAEINTWNVTVLAEADGGEGVMMTAAPFVKLTVEEPFVSMKLNLTTAKQGESVKMLASVSKLRDFDGQADVQLFALPSHATVPVVKIDKATTEIALPIQTDEKTPVGQHKNMFCTVTVMKEGEPIVHRVGMGGVLRVDPKPKEVVAAKAASTKVAANDSSAAPEKPLSRLEQLRLEAKAQAAQ